MLSKNELYKKNKQELAQYLDALKTTAQTKILTEDALTANQERQQFVTGLIAQHNKLDDGDESHSEELPILNTEYESVPITRSQQDIELATFYLSKVREAKKRHIDFSLTLSDMRRLVMRKRCQYTKTAFIEGDPKYQRSLERLDRNKGYTADNTVVVCAMFNELKNHIFENPSTKHPSRRELLLFAQKMVEIFGD